jgi:hypothetical protein
MAFAVDLTAPPSLFIPLKKSIALVAVVAILGLSPFTELAAHRCFSVAARSLAASRSRSIEASAATFAIMTGASALQY